MTNYNITDKKITQSTTDRRRYYAPSKFGTTCPYVKLDADGKPEIFTDVTGGVPHQKCACKESAPFCSYHLGREIEEEDGTKHFECHRYLVWHEDVETYKSPVDTHERQLKLKGNMLGWF